MVAGIRAMQTLEGTGAHLRVSPFPPFFFVLRDPFSVSFGTYHYFPVGFDLQLMIIS